MNWDVIGGTHWMLVFMLFLVFQYSIFLFCLKSPFLLDSSRCVCLSYFWEISGTKRTRCSWTLPMWKKIPIQIWISMWNDVKKKSLDENWRNEQFNWKAPIGEWISMRRYIDTTYIHSTDRLLEESPSGWRAYCWLSEWICQFIHSLRCH